MKILVLNAGSSSVKCWYADLATPLPPEAPKPLWSAQLNPGSGEWIGALLAALEPLWSIQSPQEIDIVGHRVVHGGSQYRQTTWITPEVREAIAGQEEFAPAHNRFELEAIRRMGELLGPRARQAAVFDTASIPRSSRPRMFIPVLMNGWSEACAASAFTASVFNTPREERRNC